MGALDGTAALLRTATGAIIWRASSGREVGTLVHDGARAYVAFGCPLRLIRGRRRESPEQFRRRQERLQAGPARLEARDAGDGRLLWRRADWRLTGRLNVAADAEAGVVAVASTSVYGDQALYGLDARTGATLWTRPPTGHMQRNGYRFALRGGRLYCYGAGGAGGLVVLDAANGRTLWEHAPLPDLDFSPGGRVVVEQVWRPDAPTVIRLLAPATGDTRRELALEGIVRALTDGGVAYLSPFTAEDPGLAAALRLDDGRELWRVGEVRAHQLAVTDAAVYCARVLVPPNIGEVEALDAGDGQLLWHALPTTDVSFMPPALPPSRPPSQPPGAPRSGEQVAASGCAS